MFGVVLIFTPFIDEDGDLRGGGETECCGGVCTEEEEEGREQWSGEN